MKLMKEDAQDWLPSSDRQDNDKISTPRITIHPIPCNIHLISCRQISIHQQMLPESSFIQNQGNEINLIIGTDIYIFT